MEKPKKILVVDDEMGIRLLLSEALMTRGFKVSLASDGMESLQKLEQDRFDLIVTDINMPNLDGVSMLKRMKQTGRNEKVIIMTGDPSDKRLSDEGLPPVEDHLFKPFGLEGFLEVVTAATT
ncbi:MAG: response regulator [Deltaproteobacteria bacterium]|nr:response regulator [Deltaproteobacteria bacterium]MBW2047155.1 response regulator [Deltaproteobacteria bacterium]MBW2109832.1 response regulator [Deltaproteobacteria bacterium]MBW2352542.1 response regulator [Deltaproteobacteria bacterium]HDZ91276.1 response regulator [Deltaproteobacteria bacterium]